MTNHCDKCGAATRWYDEKCPACGAVRTVALPTTPISLPHFTSSVAAEPPQNNEGAKETQTEQNNEDAKETQTEQNSEDAKETQTEQNNEDAKETQTEQNSESFQARAPKPPSRSRRRLAQLKNDLDAWRLAFNPRAASVTLPPTRTLRYALGIAFELLVCPPCALVAAYFFTRALRADRRARYHEAMNNAEKARLALGVGLGAFALGLCAFMYYVHSRDIGAPTLPTSHRLFR